MMHCQKVHESVSFEKGPPSTFRVRRNSLQKEENKGVEETGDKGISFCTVSQFQWWVRKSYFQVKIKRENRRAFVWQLWWSNNYIQVKHRENRIKKVGRESTNSGTLWLNICGQAINVDIRKPTILKNRSPKNKNNEKKNEWEGS